MPWIFPEVSLTVVYKGLMGSHFLLFTDDSTGDRIRDLESQLNSQQETFSDKMKDMEAIIKRQEEIIAKMTGQKQSHITNGDF